MKKSFKFLLINLLLLACCLIALNQVNAQVNSTPNPNPNSHSHSDTKPNPETELKAILTPLESMQGSFKQEISNEQGKIIQACEGKMWLKKPGQFRWEVQGKDRRLVVADGKKVWDYDIDLEQVTVQKLLKGQSTAPIFFLSGETESLSKDFKVIALKTNTEHFINSDQIFELRPKSSQGSFQWIRIGFKNKMLNELELLDHLGQYSKFTFSELQLNQTMANKLFQFTAPKGVDVVGL